MAVHTKTPDTPWLSIIIPARNEEECLPRCLASIREAGHILEMPYEIIVVLNRCTDRTGELAEEAGCRTIVENEKNLSVIRNAGVRVARGAVCLTVDADSRLSKDYITRVRKELQSGEVIGGGTLRILPERYSAGILATGLMLIPVALAYGISGGAFFFTREAFDAVGGFDPAVISAEDIHFARKLRKYAKARGKKFRNFIGPHIVTSCRKFDRFGDWYFVKHPGLFIRLLRGSDREGADRVWYDFPRK